MKAPVALLALLALPGVVLAQAPQDPAGVGTNIIGSQEAPTVLNVVPWKEREVKLDRRDPTSALLDRVLEPLDPDVLMREVEYHHLLNHRAGDADMFLE